MPTVNTESPTKQGPLNTIVGLERPATLGDGPNRSFSHGIGELACSPANPVHISNPLRSIRKIKGWMKRVWPVFGPRDWVAGPNVQLIEKGTGKYLATGSDPQLKLPYRLRPGWYRLEVQLGLPTAMADIRIYPNMGQGESEQTAFGQRISTNTLAKRILYLPEAAKLRLDPMSMVGEFQVLHLRLARTTQSLAIKRMRKKLAARYSSYQPPLSGRRATEVDQSSELAQLWNDYNALFENFTSGRESVSYQDWIQHVEQPAIPSRAAQIAEAAAWAWHPRFSIILPTYNTDPVALRACLDSVCAQTYANWELCVADDASTEAQVRNILDEYAARDARIKVCHRPRNGHIVQASNQALTLATGDFVVLLDHDDVLASHALYSVAQTLQGRPAAQLLYSDEDKLDVTGARCDPYFKPDFSPDLLYSQNYFSHLGVYRRELVEAVGGFRSGFEGSQDYDLVLRCVARVSDQRDVIHIPHVLYHWRMAPGSTASGHEHKTYALEAARNALQDHFDSRCGRTQVSVITPGLYRQIRPLPAPEPLISLIVPTRDGCDLLKTCIDSIVQRTTYPHYEILVVDNQSTCSRTLSYMNEIDGNGRVRLLRYDQPFNYSAINNFAAKHAQGTVLGLINNDVEVITAEWLTEMVSQALRPDIGCVGAKLYYPDETLQHGGVVLGIGGVAGHSHKYFPRAADGYFSRLRIVHNVSAVTGAALIVRKEIFDAVGGLDEKGLHVAFNDVDFCLKVMKAGYRNLWTPFAELYHHESKTRGTDHTPERQHRFQRECELMRQRWGDLLSSDPYYSPHLSRQHEDYSLAMPHRGAR